MSFLIKENPERVVISILSPTFRCSNCGRDNTVSKAGQLCSTCQSDEGRGEAERS